MAKKMAGMCFCVVAINLPTLPLHSTPKTASIFKTQIDNGMFLQPDFAAYNLHKQRHDGRPSGH
jgi:hypothetical protein